jgi:hypothetical protein
VPGDVDRADLFEAEVPRGVGIEERPHETSAGGVHVQRHVDPPLAPDPQQQVVDADDVVLVPGERRSEHGGDTDRVLIDVGFHVVGADRVFSRPQRHDPGLGDWAPDQAWMRTPAQATFSVVDTAEELEALLPAELYAVALQTTQGEPVVEDLDI